MKKFVIVCYPRTGSYRLVDILNQHNDVICCGEIFKPNVLEIRDDVREHLDFHPSDHKERNENAQKYIDSFYNALEAMGAKAGGFKIFPSHSDAAIKYCLKSKDISVIFLGRNPVQQHVSFKKAQDSNLWVDDGQSAITKESSSINFENDQFVNRLHKLYEFYIRVMVSCSVYDKKCTEIDYLESLSQDGIDRVFSTIGIQNAGVAHSTHKKIIQDSYDKVVSNWGETKQLMARMGVDENMTFFQFLRQVVKL